MDKFNRVLVINLGGIGDLLLSTPALKALKNANPLARISILIVPRCYELVGEFTFIDDIFIFDKRLVPFGLFKNFLLLCILRSNNYDLLINMRTLVSARSAVFMNALITLINPRFKAGRDTDGRGRFFDISITETLKGEKYERDYDIELVKALGVEVKHPRIDFQIKPAELDRLNRILEANGISGNEVIVGVHPGGAPSHRWPIEKFSYSMREIAKKIDCKFVVSADKKEKFLAKQLEKQSGLKVINLAGKLGIKELAGLISRCRLYITNDSGPMHIAAVLGVPMIAIFGPGYLIRFDPRNITDKAVVFKAEVKCQPCDRQACLKMDCFKDISAQEVANAALGLLKL